MFHQIRVDYGKVLPNARVSRNVPTFTKQTRRFMLQTNSIEKGEHKRKK